MLSAAGALLLSLAGFFLWRDLDVPLELSVSLIAGATAAIAFSRIPRTLPLLVPTLLVFCSVVGGVWYAATKHDVLLYGVAAAMVASIVSVARASRGGATPVGLEGVVLWYGFAAAVVAFTGAFYFRFFTIGFAEAEIGRRIVLTGLWLLLGAAMVVRARATGATVVRDAGFGLLAIALAKALFYDTTHLDGVWRIGGLAALGLVLLSSAWVSSRTPAKVNR